MIRLKRVFTRKNVFEKTLRQRKSMRKLKGEPTGCSHRFINRLECKIIVNLKLSEFRNQGRYDVNCRHFRHSDRKSFFLN